MTILIKHIISGQILYEGQHSCMRAAAEAAVAASFSLDGANLNRANLNGAHLNCAGLSWTSRDLLSEILWSAADTESRQMLAALVGRRRDWCWEQWATWGAPGEGLGPRRAGAMGPTRRWRTRDRPRGELCPSVTTNRVVSATGPRAERQSSRASCCASTAPTRRGPTCTMTVGTRMTKIGECEHD